MKTTLTLCALAMISMPAQAALIAAWNMDDASGNIIDSTGGHPDAIPNGTASIDYAQPGVPNGTYGSIILTTAAGTSLGFGPSTQDDFFQSGSSNSLPVMNVPRTGSMTVMAWINPNSPTLGATYRPISSGSSLGSDRGWGVGLRFATAGSTTASIRWTNYGILDNDSDTFTVVFGEWIHMAATYNNGAITYFLNGNQLGGSDTSLFGDELAAARLTIGGRIGANDVDQVNGRLDGLRVYDTVLTAAQIQAAAIEAVSVPEPSAAGIAALGLLGMAFRRRR